MLWCDNKDSKSSRDKNRDKNSYTTIINNTKTNAKTIINNTKNMLSTIKTGLDKSLVKTAVVIGKQSINTQRIATNNIERTIIRENTIRSKNTGNDNSKELIKEVADLRKIMTHYAQNPVPSRAYLDDKEAKKITRTGITEIRKTSI